MFAIYFPLQPQLILHMHTLYCMIDNSVSIKLQMLCCCYPTNCAVNYTTSCPSLTSTVF